MGHRFAVGHRRADQEVLDAAAPSQPELEHCEQGSEDRDPFGLAELAQFRGQGGGQLAAQLPAAAAALGRPGKVGRQRQGKGGVAQLLLPEQQLPVVLGFGRRALLPAGIVAVLRARRGQRVLALAVMKLIEV